MFTLNLSFTNQPQAFISLFQIFIFYYVDILYVIIIIYLLFLKRQLLFRIWYSEPENSGIGSRLFDSSYDFKKSIKQRLWKQTFVL